MGIFSMISNAVREGKEKAVIENMKFAEKLEYCGFEQACRLIHEELKAGGLARRSGLIKLFNEQLKKTDDKSVLYPAFTYLYQLAYRREDTIALSLANRIGKKLYEEGDFRVEANEDETRFYPRTKY